MPQYFHRLENALKRANEFIDVGKKLEALEILCDVLRSRKHRTWQKNHADIMVKYLELCVELRKSYIAKEGIYQYKIICQQTQIKSFEDVVRKYLELAEGKAEAAKEAAQAATIDVDDLDNLATPENILLSAVSSEVSQDRTDRVLLLPWVKFLWESYRQCLDLLKNNARTEKLYHDIAHKAFQFCIKFNRKTEFRKLCDNLHTHLDILKKQQQQLTQQQPPTHALQNIVNLSNPESQALHLETRLQQLDCAITMELWQEAYKATDDIKRFNLMNLSKKPLKPQLMASYYQKLALVFYKANCPLFHAAALVRHFLLTKEWRKNIKEEDVQKMASKVVAATLSMPIPPSRPEIDKLVDTEENVVENHHRNLASLLGLSVTVPSRSSLIRDLKRMNILNYAFPELQQLYQWLEQDFDPLLLCKRVEGVTSFIEKTDTGSTDLKAYVQPLKEVAIVRLLKEISQIYSTIQIKRVLELCPFADTITLEHFVVSAARRNDLPVRIDHRRGCLHFGKGNVSVSQEVTEGPHIQSMPSSQIRQQLVNMFSALQNARALIEPEKIKNNRDKLKTRIMMDYDRNKTAQHRKMLERSKFIELRKEEIAMIRQEIMAQEERQQEEQLQRLKREEEARIKKENEERIRLRQAQEEEDLKRRMAKDTIDNMRLTEAGQKILETFGESELADLKVEDIKSKQWEQLEKERKEQIARQQKLERKNDHLERAKRLEELPLLEAAAGKDVILNQEIFEKMEKERIEELKAERVLALEHRDRLLRMKSEASQFAQKIKSYRYAEYEVKLNDWKNKVAQARATRIEERRKKREEDRRREYYRQKKEEEEKRREEEKRAQMEREKEERERERAKLDEAAQKQRQRDAEIEARLERERGEAFKKQEPTIIPVRDMDKSRADVGSWERGGLSHGEDVRQRNAAPPPDEREWRDRKEGPSRETRPREVAPRDGGLHGPSESGAQRWQPRRFRDEQQPQSEDSGRGEVWRGGNRSSGMHDRQPMTENRGDDRPNELNREPPPVRESAQEPQVWRRGGGVPQPSHDVSEPDRDQRRDFGPSEKGGGRRDFGDDGGRRGFNRAGPPRDGQSRGFDDHRRSDGPPRVEREDWSRGPRDSRETVKPKKILDVPERLRRPNEPAPITQQRDQTPKDGEDGWTSVKKR